MSLKWFDFVVIVLAMALMMKVLSIMSPDPKPVPEDPDQIIADMWQKESSPEDRYLILTGLSAMQCIDAGICQLAMDEPVRSPSE